MTAVFLSRLAKGQAVQSLLRLSSGLRLLVVVSGIPFAAVAQSVPMVQLKAPTGTISGAFSRISSVRELADGRVLVTDERENAVFVGDFRTGTFATIGRAGRGPGEYTDVGRLWPVPNDSTIMVDRGNRRWLILHGARFVETVPPDQAGPMAASGTGRVLLGIAHSGEGLAGSYTLQVADGVGMPSELAVTRFHRNRTTVGAMDAPPAARPPPAPVAARPGVRLDGNGARRTNRAYSMAFIGLDQAIMFPDGWTAIARVNPYRVEWCPPVGTTCSPGPELWPSAPLLRLEDRQVYLDWVSRLTNWPPTSELAQTTGWPSVVPPFIPPPNALDQSALVAAPDGRLLIWKTPDVSSREAQFDIIDRQGRRVADLRAPLNYRVIGFGTRSVYVIVADDDGLQSLQRHPWP